MNLVLYLVGIIALCAVSGKTNAKSSFNASLKDLDSETPVDNRELIRIARKSPRYRQPFMVAIINRHSKSISCGGSILTPEYVVTAAHCFYGKNKDDFYLAAGVNYLDRAGYGAPNTKDIATVYLHEEFRLGDGTCLNDIALLKVSEPFVFNKLIQAIPVAGDETIARQECTTIGWGVINDDGDEPNPLQEITTSILKSDACERQLFGQGTYENTFSNQGSQGSHNKSSVTTPKPNRKRTTTQSSLIDPQTEGNPHQRSTAAQGNNRHWNKRSPANPSSSNQRYPTSNELFQSMICAESDETIKPCRGDSGGPLICNDELHGIVSFGSSYCFTTKRPTYYTKVIAFRDWLGRHQIPLPRV